MTKPKVLIATPIAGDVLMGNVIAGFHQAQLRLCRSKDLEFDLVPAYHQTDIIRARSGMARDFLATDCDGVLWWDSDVTDDDVPRLARLIATLASSGHDLCGAAYPRKRFHWKRVEALCAEARGVTPAELKGAAFDHVAVANFEAGENVSVPIEIGKDHFASISHLGMGFTWTSRACVERMTDRYQDELGYVDSQWDGQQRPTVALFQLMFRNGRLLSEDYSFCTRWRDMGGKVMLYVGEHARLKHIGSMVYG